MSVCGYNYMLQWIYGHDVSSDINAWFCTYCAHSMRIDTNLHKMHENKVSKVYMWLVVEEVRAYHSVMDWGIMFGVVVPEVGASGGTVNLEVALAGGIPDPLEACANRV